MKIHSMTATFGKLEHQTLTLEPGLNIIHAPNEWGKSTWCAFLVTMLYGLETRERSTKTTLADKDRYAPWSGSPMSGRIDLSWQGRQITIERSSKGRTPLGVFRAYETETGLPVPELTAANCGQTLLGVERSVFTKAGFLRFSELPVTNDENLRHRLNALVTTGDDSGEAEALEQKLRDLKNRCRYNKSGLLPQAEGRRDELDARLDQFRALSDQHARLLENQRSAEARIGDLENHLAALDHAAAQEDMCRVEAAAAAREEARSRLDALTQAVRGYPDKETARRELQRLEQLRQEQDALGIREHALPQLPALPQTPAPFQDMTPAQALAQASRDAAQPAPGKNRAPILLGLGLLAAFGGVALMILQPLAGIGAVCAAAALLIAGFAARRRHRQSLTAAEELRRRYGSDDPRDWLALAESYEREWDVYRQRREEALRAREELDRLREKLSQQLGGESLTERMGFLRSVLSAWEELSQAGSALDQAVQHHQALKDMARSAPPPARPDGLTLTRSQSEQLLSDTVAERHAIIERIGQCSGQMMALGSMDAVRRERDAVCRRIDELELTYAALDRSLRTLTVAKSELQRRFAPRITQRAQELFRELTGGHYDRMSLAEDLSIQAGAEGEATLRSPLHRSDGTADQLYLALRLAVARELTPDAPLVLDDALVRFDDTRLSAAMAILRREAEDKQVILFTCQSREQTAL